LFVLYPNGEQPGDLPVQKSIDQQPTTNLKAATTFGIKVAPALLARADEPIMQPCDRAHCFLQCGEPQFARTRRADTHWQCRVRAS